MTENGLYSTAIMAICLSGYDASLELGGQPVHDVVGCMGCCPVLLEPILRQVQAKLLINFWEDMFAEHLKIPMLIYGDVFSFWIHKPKDVDHLTVHDSNPAHGFDIALFIGLPDLIGIFGTPDSVEQFNRL